MQLFTTALYTYQNALRKKNTSRHFLLNQLFNNSFFNSLKKPLTILSAALLLISISGCLPEVSFTATPLASDPENASTLSWNVRANTQVPVSEIERIIIEPDIGEVDFSGSEIVTPEETTVYTLTAVAVDQNGLYWTQSQNTTVYIGPLVGDLTFNDPNLAACVADAGFTYVEQIKFLNCVSRGIVDLTGIEALTHLNILNIDINEISDLTPLSTLTKLHTLNIGANQISDLTPLANISTLDVLSIYGNQITDLTPLAVITGLTALTINNNQISDLSPIVDLPALNILSMSGNLVEDISVLSTLTSLLVLDASFNQINSGILELRSLTNANLIRLDGNPDGSCLEYLQLLAALQVVTFTSCTFP